MLDCDGWIQKALEGLAETLPATHEPMRTAQPHEAWLVWREMSQRQIRASGETLGVQHNLRLTISCREGQDHQLLTRRVQEHIRQQKGCLYVRLAGDQWNHESQRRECLMYLGILEAV